MKNSMIQLKPVLASSPQRIILLMLGGASVVAACTSPGDDTGKFSSSEKFPASVGAHFAANANDVDLAAAGSTMASANVDAGAASANLDDGGAAPAKASSPDPTPDVVGPHSARTGTRVRPALTGDLMALSRDELVRRDYPVRPDPIGRPDAYRDWADEVTRPFTIVDIAAVRSPGRSNTALTPTLSANAYPWAATEMTSPQSDGVPLRRHLYQVYGTWYVPTIVNNTPAKSSLWVGLDGDINYGGPNADLPQMGTEQSVNPAGTPYYDFWVQVPPYDPCQWTWTGMAVHPGDLIAVGLFVGDSNRVEDAWYGDYVWYYATNRTTGITSGWIDEYFLAGNYPTTCSPSPPTQALSALHSVFTGQTAEAVLEVTGAKLTDINSASITGFYVDDYTYAWNNLTSSAGTCVYNQLYLTNPTTNDLLAYPYADTVNSTSYFSWWNYQ